MESSKISTLPSTLQFELTLDTVNGKYSHANQNQLLCNFNFETIEEENNVQLKIKEEYECLSTFTLSTISKKSGRLPGLLTYDVVQHENKLYAVITIQHKKNDVQFVINYENLTNIINRPWHLSSGKYIATNIYLDDGKIKEVYLHNFLKIGAMDCSNEKLNVIHLNNNFLDNRIENLKLVSADDYNPIKNKRKRTILLPEGCGFTSDEIPKYVSYLKANGEHGDRFVIEIPKLNICKKLSSSKKISLKDKLEEAKKVLHEIYSLNPEINPEKENELKMVLEDSFQKIIRSKDILEL